MARRKKQSGLGSPRATHEEIAQAAISNTRRFIEASERPNASCHAILQSVIVARMYGNLAVFEARAARTKKMGGPTDLQREASRAEDAAIKASELALHHCSRGYPRFKRKR